MSDRVILREKNCSEKYFKNLIIDASFTPFKHKINSI